MDRQIVYPGAIPLETDLLNTNKFAMIGLAKLASALLGHHTYLSGLACQPVITEPMKITVGEGQIYSLQSVDGIAFSSLPPDTEVILKQGLKAASETFHLPAPLTSDHSINYLIQVAYSDEDIGPTVLPYYNAANPAVAYSGPDNTGTAQKTIRSGKCVVSVKTGVAATTGKQLTPPPDNGHVAAWVISVPYGATSIEGRFITQASGAPFLPEEGLVTAVQQRQLTYGEDAGIENHYQVSFRPTIRSLNDGIRLYFRARHSNTGPSYLAVDQLPDSRILTTNHGELKAEQIRQESTVEVEWNSTLSAWILCSASDSYSRHEADERFFPFAGGEITGDVDIGGKVKIGKALQMGEAEVTTEGDVKGPCWKGSLSNWLKASKSKKYQNKDAWCFRDPSSGLKIQGGKGTFSHDKGKMFFPVKFPVACFSVHLSQGGKNKRSTDNMYVTNVNNVSFMPHLGSGEVCFFWVAFGM